MYGVVLWSDSEEKKAVIWCEDHGDLAFYNAGENSAFDGPSLDAGDLVHFQLSEGREMRFARNPRLVAEQQYPLLAQQLKANGFADTTDVAPDARQYTASEADSNVVPFQARGAGMSLVS